MFFQGSRYEKLVPYRVTKPDGTMVSVTRLPMPVQSPLLGFHRRHEGQRLDLIAAHYLADPTSFWKLCDASNAIVPDALAAHDLIGVRGKGA